MAEENKTKVEEKKQDPPKVETKKESSSVAEKGIEQPISQPNENLKEEAKSQAKTETPKKEPAKPETKKEPVKSDSKADAKPEPKKEKKKPVATVKKEKAIAKGSSLKVSKRQCMYICSFIKNKPIDKAIEDLEQVIKFKKIVPFKGEIPHRKGPGIMSGRYPIKASALLIKTLKGLKGNAITNGLEPETTRITLASANWASRPVRSGNRKGKRTHVTLEAREVKK
jgi:ribosomal protein L22